MMSRQTIISTNYDQSRLSVGIVLSIITGLIIVSIGGIIYIRTLSNDSLVAPIPSPIISQAPVFITPTTVPTLSQSDRQRIVDTLSAEKDDIPQELLDEVINPFTE